MLRMEKIWRFENILKQELEKLLTKWVLGILFSKSENEKIKGEGTWSKAACPRWSCKDARICARVEMNACRNMGLFLYSMLMP